MTTWINRLLTSCELPGTCKMKYGYSTTGLSLSNNHTISMQKGRQQERYQHKYHPEEDPPGSNLARVSLSVSEMKVMVAPLLMADDCECSDSLLNKSTLSILSFIRELASHQWNEISTFVMETGSYSQVENPVFSTYFQTFFFFQEDNWREADVVLIYKQEPGVVQTNVCDACCIQDWGISPAATSCVTLSQNRVLKSNSCESQLAITLTDLVKHGQIMAN